MATNIMRCVLLMALSPLLSAASVDSTKNVQLQTASVDVNFISPFHPFSKEARRERRKERRILRKKKQRLRELREEIRILTHSLQQTNATATFDKTEVKLKQKGRQGRKGIKWRKSLLEKLKGIVRRLDRMERRLVEGNQIVSSEVMPTIGNISSVSLATTPTTLTPPSMNETLNQKLKRIQPAISRSRSGENGTACSAHKDCRPGHCCHRFILGRNETQSMCVLHRLTEGAECVDGCQCSTQLNCFLPDARLIVNATNAVCKKAASSDILTGSYLYQKDSVIVVSGSN